MNRSGNEKERRCHHRDREQKNASEVHARRVRAKPSARRFRERNSGVRRPLERRPARVDQIIADMPRDFVLRGFRQRQRLRRSFAVPNISTIGRFPPPRPGIDRASQNPGAS